MTMQFTRAIRKRAKLRLALAGPSGSGKTYGALTIAKGLGGRIAVIDTERGSASLYSHLTEFDTLSLDPPYAPERFIEAVHAAEAAGYDVIVIDSITHEWNGSGGVLEIVDNIAKASRSGNSYNAWNEGTRRHRAFIDAMLQSSAHIIATMRTKAAYVQEKNEKSGKTEIKKVGMAPEQRDGVEYEFTVVLDIVNDSNIACASKDRTGLFTSPNRITEKTGVIIRDWLESGAEPAPNETPKPVDPHAENREKRDKVIRTFKALLRNDDDQPEETVNERIYTGHERIAKDHEFYEAVWSQLDSTERAAIKASVDAHKKTLETVNATGRAA